MSSKQTDGSQKKMQIPDDFTLTQMVGGITKLEKSTDENGIDPNETIQQDDTQDSLQTEAMELVISMEAQEPPIPTVTPKRTTCKQRKESLEEYRQTFLTVPKLEDRKPVFISREVRDKIDEIVHRLGGRGRSVSGFIENLARHHLAIYQDDVDGWKKL